MSTKQIIITSLGLKNIVLSKYQDDADFIFAFGEREFRMKSFFAEFISPVVSRLHQTDPTINKINFGELYRNNNRKFNTLSKTIFSSEIISFIIQISSGFSIEINEEQAIKLRFLSILLGNEELHNKLNKLFPPKYSEKSVNLYLKNIECFYHISQYNHDFDFSSLLSFVSSHFDKLNKDDFLRVPRNLQHAIISHPNLRIESEDSLFDIVVKIIERGHKNEEIGDVFFLEEIEFTRLSEDRLRTFFDFFDVNQMSGRLWSKLVRCFFNYSGDTTKPSIIVGGSDESNLLGVNPNNRSENENDYQYVSPPLKSSLDPSSLLSYSIFCEHSVLVTKDGSLLGIGNNTDGRICGSLTKTQFSQFTKFSINDDRGHQLTPVSAACSKFGTLYMLSKVGGNGMQLVYCDGEINSGAPILLDIGDQEPVALFSGYTHTAAIGDNGDVILVNHFSVKNSPNSPIAAVSLPDGEKASSIAFFKNTVVVLSSSGRVFSSDIKGESSPLRFTAVSRLAGEEIVCVSGSYLHCLAVTKDGRVFGCGSNEDGELGLGEETHSVSLFTEIPSFGEYKIREAYAGGSHSLFVTQEGKILACGYNEYGELLLRSGPGEPVYLPTKTTINGGATFCITGDCLSIVFGRKSPPNMPNKRVQVHMQ